MATTTTGMTMGTTTTDSALLQLIWLASPALPVGGFSYSEGLESAVDAGLVKDEGTAADWLAAQLQMTLARADLAVVAQAITAWRANDHDTVARLDAWLLATRETAELRQQTEQMGRSMVEWLKSLGRWMPDRVRHDSHEGRHWGHDSQVVRHCRHDRQNVRHCGPVSEGPSIPPQSMAARQYTYPIAFAYAAASSTASSRDAALAFAFGWAENMTQAAIKSVPLGQSAGQRILARLANDIPAAVDHALALDEDARQAFSPMLAILSSRHETQYSRLFRS